MVLIEVVKIVECVGVVFVIIGGGLLVEVVKCIVFYVGV